VDRFLGLHGELPAKRVEGDVVDGRRRRHVERANVARLVGGLQGNDAHDKCQRRQKGCRRKRDTGEPLDLPAKHNSQRQQPADRNQGAQREADLARCLEVQTVDSGDRPDACGQHQDALDHVCSRLDELTWVERPGPVG
jgi:hypothetical protein